MKKIDQADECRVTFKKVMNVVMNFKTKQHMRFLGPFVKVFRSYDQKNSGFIPKKNLTNLLRKLNAKGAISRTDLEKCMPQDSFEYINFSDLVDLLTDNWIQVGDEKATFLKALCQQ